MPVVKFSTSALGKSIVNDVKKFISDNGKAMEGDGDQLTTDKAADALANAIAYGIAKAFSSTVVQVAFSTGGICPPAGGPVGSMIFSILKPQATEV